MGSKAAMWVPTGCCFPQKISLVGVLLTINLLREILVSGMVFRLCVNSANILSPWFSYWWGNSESQRDWNAGVDLSCATFSSIPGQSRTCVLHQKYKKHIYEWSNSIPAGLCHCSSLHASLYCGSWGQSMEDFNVMGMIESQVERGQVASLVTKCPFGDKDGVVIVSIMDSKE